MLPVCAVTFDFATVSEAKHKQQWLNDPTIPAGIYSKIMLRYMITYYFNYIISVGSQTHMLRIFARR